MDNNTIKATKNPKRHNCCATMPAMIDTIINTIKINMA